MSKDIVSYLSHRGTSATAGGEEREGVIRKYSFFTGRLWAQLGEMECPCYDFGR